MAVIRRAKFRQDDQQPNQAERAFDLETSPDRGCPDQFDHGQAIGERPAAPDWVEVGRIFWQEQAFGAGRADERSLWGDRWRSPIHLLRQPVFH